MPLSRGTEIQAALKLARAQSAKGGPAIFRNPLSQRHCAPEGWSSAFAAPLRTTGRSESERDRER
eukprot:15207868-Alexandrium_andersonii.AAC.1